MELALSMKKTVENIQDNFNLGKKYKLQKYKNGLGEEWYENGDYYKGQFVEN